MGHDNIKPSLLGEQAQQLAGQPVASRQMHGMPDESNRRGRSGRLLFHCRSRRRTLASVDDEQRNQEEQDDGQHQQAAFRSVCTTAP